MAIQVNTFDFNYNFAHKSSFGICTVKNSKRYEAISGNIRQINVRFKNNVVSINCILSF